MTSDMHAKCRFPRHHAAFERQSGAARLGAFCLASARRRVASSAPASGRSHRWLGTAQVTMSSGETARPTSGMRGVHKCQVRPMLPELWWIEKLKAIIVPGAKRTECLDFIRCAVVELHAETSSCAAV